MILGLLMVAMWTALHRSYEGCVDLVRSLSRKSTPVASRPIRVCFRLATPQRPSAYRRVRKWRDGFWSSRPSVKYQAS